MHDLYNQQRYINCDVFGTFGAPYHYSLATLVIQARQISTHQLLPSLAIRCVCYCSGNHRYYTLDTVVAWSNCGTLLALIPCHTSLTTLADHNFKVKSLKGLLLILPHPHKVYKLASLQMENIIHLSPYYSTSVTLSKLIDPYSAATL